VVKTRTTTRSYRDLETAKSNFWSPVGVRRRPQRVPSAGSGGGTAASAAAVAGAAVVAAGAALYPNG